MEAFFVLRPAMKAFIVNSTPDKNAATAAEINGDVYK
jgi:hypothetical protein